MKLHKLRDFFKILKDSEDDPYKVFPLYINLSYMDEAGFLIEDLEAYNVANLHDDKKKLIDTYGDFYITRITLSYNPVSRGYNMNIGIWNCPSETSDSEVITASELMGLMDKTMRIAYSDYATNDLVIVPFKLFKNSPNMQYLMSEVSSHNVLNDNKDFKIKEIEFLLDGHLVEYRLILKP